VQVIKSVAEEKVCAFYSLLFFTSLIPDALAAILWHRTTDMSKATIVTIMMLTYFNVTAQTSNTWLTFLNSIKQEFYLKDSIAFTFDMPKQENEYPNYLKPVKAEYCDKLFTTERDLGVCKGGEKFFYSFKLSKRNYATLTFYSFGKYTPVLTLYNYSPKGELLNQIEIKSSFFDAGQADTTAARLTSDTTFIVSRWDGWEATENGKSVMVDSLTITDYSIRPTGQIQQGKQHNSRRTR
jgi:hypothetical protein